jgi:hypothetical protein
MQTMQMVGEVGRFLGRDTGRPLPEMALLREAISVYSGALRPNRGRDDRSANNQYEMACITTAGSPCEETLPAGRRAVQ